MLVCTDYSVNRQWSPGAAMRIAITPSSVEALSVSCLTVWHGVVLAHLLRKAGHTASIVIIGRKALARELERLINTNEISIADVLGDLEEVGAIVIGETVDREAA